MAFCKFNHQVYNLDKGITNLPNGEVAIGRERLIVNHCLKYCNEVQQRVCEVLKEIPKPKIRYKV